MTAFTHNPPLIDSFPLSVDAPFTRAMARAAGVSDNQLARLCARNGLRRPLRNVYLPAHLPDTLELRLAALSLVVPEGSFITDHSAAWLHAGDIALPPNAHLAVPEVSVFRPSQTRALRNGWTTSGERTLAPRDLVTMGNLRVTTPLRTGLDLCRLQRNRDVALWGADCMLGLGVFTLEEFLLEIPRFKGQRGVVRLRALGPLADGGSQSFGEAALRLRWHDAGLPRPRVQIAVMVNGRVIFWLDMGLEELLFAAEYDGEEFHTDQADQDHDSARRGWLAENRSWIIEPFRKHNVFGHHQDAELRLRRAYQRALSTLGSRTIIIL